MPLVYLNGEFLPAEDACVPVLDRGFIFGDSIYEVIPVYSGHLFRFDEHMQRLQNCLDEVRIPNPLTRESWHEILSKLISDTTVDFSVYLQVTRGVAVRDHAIPNEITPTVFAMANPMSHPGDEQITRGVKVITCEDIRWKNCHIKATSLLSNVLLRQQAVDVGAVESVLIRDGYITEGSASNIFIVKFETLITPPKSSNLLPGITRDLIIELAEANNISCREADITINDLMDADEVWLTSSTKEVLSVSHIDGNVVGQGTPGALWAKMHKIYQEYKQQL